MVPYFGNISSEMEMKKETTGRSPVIIGLISKLKSYEPIVATPGLGQGVEEQNIP